MDKNSTKYYSTKQEKMVADALGGYAIGGSGAMPTNPGDVKTYDWLVECKTHTEPGHTIFFDLAVWKKIEEESMATHRKPVLIVDDGSQKEQTTWCLCRSKNLNLSRFITTQLPCTVKKNISCKHDKLEKALKENTSKFLGEFYTHAAFELTWGDEEVCIMPLGSFKEIFEN